MSSAPTTEESYSSNESMFYSNPLLFIVLVLLIPAFGIGLIGLAIWYVKSKSTHLEIARGNVVFSRGIISKDNIDFPVSAVRSVNVRQSLLERWTGAGTVQITTAGDTPEVVAAGMPNVAAIKRLLKRG